MSDSIHEKIVLSIIFQYSIEYTQTTGHLLGHKHIIFWHYSR